MPGKVLKGDFWFSSSLCSPANLGRTMKESPDEFVLLSLSGQEVCTVRLTCGKPALTTPNPPRFPLPPQTPNSEPRGTFSPSHPGNTKFSNSESPRDHLPLTSWQHRVPRGFWGSPLPFHFQQQWAPVGLHLAGSPVMSLREDFPEHF